MAITKEIKQQIIKDYKTHKNDTGSVEVQVAILTYEIKELTLHIKEHPQDKHCKYGLQKKIGQRRRLLNYLASRNLDRYQILITKLGLRR